MSRSKHTEAAIKQVDTGRKIGKTNMDVTVISDD
jgi:hypothetical protein